MITTPIQYALLSVSDKTGIVDFARTLSEMSITLLSTGGTARMLREQGIDVVDVSEFTQSPEIMNGRVKTLHPKIHGGLLARRGVDDAVMTEQAFQFIDLVVVNLYPFESTVSNPEHTLPDAIENIDIGGPTMVRAAAKNYDRVAVLVDHNDYDNIVEEIRNNNGSTTPTTRFALMKKAFTHTAHYDTAISSYLTGLNNDTHATTFPDTLNLELKKQDDLRYGENPHQNAAFYVENNVQSGTISSTKQHQGKPLSYNNIADTDAALECVKSFSGKPACVIVKHANPCGVAFRDTQLEAYERAFATDPTSSFGGIIAFNTRLEKKTAQAIIDKQFVEVIIAPDMEDGVSDIVAAKKNVRLLTTGAFQPINTSKMTRLDYKRVNGGLLAQDADDHVISQDALKTATKRTPTEKEMQDLLFAWKIVKFVKSNAIVYCKDNATIGIGAGQMSRVISAKIAGLKAEEEGLDVPGSVMASDAFFPFRDGIDAAAKAGITAIIQPGGSIRDEEIIQAADEANIAMVFTGVRHFRH